MKRYKLSLVAGVAALALGVGACDEGLTDLNEDPNAPADASVQTLLPQLLQSSVDLILGYMHLDMTGVWAGHHAEIQYAEEDVGFVREVTVINRWEDFYAGDLVDAQLIVDKGQEMNDPNVTAVGMIMKAWTFHAATDLWGDIPYSEALQGPENTTPAYDPQSAIYAGMLANLEAASDMIVADSSPFGNEDLIYGGDMAAWRKFANSLRLRLAMRAGDEAAFVDALDPAGGGVFTSNADNTVLNYLASQPNVNPIFDTFRTRDDHRVSATILGMLQDLDDPRLPVYARPADGTGEYVGMPNGLEEHTFALNETSKLGLYFSQPDAPAVLMAYPEVLFLQAEAAERGWIGGDPAALYRQGVTASMQMYNGAECVDPATQSATVCTISEADITAYLGQPEVAYDGVESIAVQKWIALFGNGQEAWSEWRRTGFPESNNAGADNILGKIPTRYPYPQTEGSLNDASLQAAISNQGGEAGLTGFVWWDTMWESQ